MNPQSLMMTILRNSVRCLLISTCAAAFWWSTPAQAQSPVLRLQQTLFGVTDTTSHVKSPVAISPDGQYLYLAETNAVVALRRA